MEVAPSADFNRLEEVTVIDPPKMPLELASLDGDEKAGTGKHLKDERRKKDSDKEEKHGIKREEKAIAPENKAVPTGAIPGGR